MPVQTEADVNMPYGILGDDANSSKFEFDQMDNKIVTATLKAFESGSLTPLIKEELRCTIQSRRLAEGKGELKVEFKTPIKKKEMNEEERRRALKRRQQNREAAQRFRQKQKNTSDYLSAKIKKLETSSHALTDDLKRLKEERELLKQMLESHLLVCTNPHIPCQSQFQSSSTTIELPPQRSPYASTCSSVTDCQSVTDSIPPDTAASDSSVFFADDDPKFTTLEPVVAVPTFGCNSNTTAEAIVYDDGQYIDVGYEETVVNVDDTDSEFDEERRPDSCSSSDALVCKAASFTTDWNCLSQSMQTVSSAYARAHLESCSSQAFDPMADDLFFLEDVTP